MIDATIAAFTLVDMLAMLVAAFTIGFALASDGR